MCTKRVFAFVSAIMLVGVAGGRPVRAQMAWRYQELGDDNDSFKIPPFRIPLRN